MRLGSLLIGLLGVVIAFITNALYSFFHVLGRMSGITNDRSHFFLGLFVILIGLVGSLFAPIIPTVGVVLLLIAGIAFFFIAGWWALLASLCLLVAAFLAFRSIREREQRQAMRQSQSWH